MIMERSRRPQQPITVLYCASKAEKNNKLKGEKSCFDYLLLLLLLLLLLRARRKSHPDLCFLLVLFLVALLTCHQFELCLPLFRWLRTDLIPARFWDERAIFRSSSLMRDFFFFVFRTFPLNLFEAAAETATTTLGLLFHLMLPHYVN
jgi:hypothetical protein